MKNEDSELEMCYKELAQLRLERNTYKALFEAFQNSYKKCAELVDGSFDPQLFQEWVDSQKRTEQTVSRIKDHVTGFHWMTGIDKFIGTNAIEELSQVWDCRN